MKKSFISAVVLILLTVLVSCTNNITPPTDIIFEETSTSYISSFESMGTIIEFEFDKKDPKINQKEAVAQEMLELFNYYHILTDNFEGYKDVNNVFYINENPNVKLPIRKELYDILKLSEDLKFYTEGYFDISIGLIIDQWKDLLNLTKPNSEDLSKTLNKVAMIPVIKDGILLEKDNNDYFITIKNGVKIDLGAIAKGYVVNLANDIAKKHGFTYYTIKGSSSSVYYGKNSHKDRDFFNIGLSKPYFDYYGVISVKNTSVTTSGDDVQGVDINKVRYHHIVSPISKKPENYRRMMTVVGVDAAISDALTTALFNMPQDVFDKWIVKNPQSVVFLNTDETIQHFNMDDYSFRVQ